MEKTLEREIRRLSGGRCEYCRVAERYSGVAFAVDHVIARQHSGPTVLANLALSCGLCNRHKGPNIAGIDPDTGQLCRLFHPRMDSWQDHFRWNGPVVMGRSGVGRTTIAVLAMNQPQQILLRETLIAEGVFEE